MPIKSTKAVTVLCINAGTLAKQPQARSTSSQSSSSGTSSKSSEQQEPAQAPSRANKGSGRNPQQSGKASAVTPQGRAFGRAPSGSNSSYPENAPGAPSQGRALAKGSSRNSFFADDPGQAGALQDRALGRGPSGNSGFAGAGPIGQAGDAPLPDAPAGDLIQCGGCGRSFNPRALEVHSRICAKIFQVSLLIICTGSSALQLLSGSCPKHLWLSQSSEGDTRVQCMMCCTLLSL